MLDADGEKLGTLEDVYFDAESDEPEFVTVTSGLIGEHLTFVPLAGASLGRENVYYGVDYAPAGTESGRRLVRR